MTARIALYRQWQADAAAYIRTAQPGDPSLRGAWLGLSDATRAEAGELLSMIERGETTYKALMEESRDVS